MESYNWFDFLYYHHHSTFNQIDSLIDSGPPIYSSPSGKEIGSRLKQLIRELAKKHSSDVKIFHSMATIVHPKNKKEINQNLSFNSSFSQHDLDRRANNRAKQVIRLLPRSFIPRTLLDVGCSEGSITMALGRMLGVDMDAISGCDVHLGGHLVNLPNFKEISSSSDDGSLPFSSNSKDLITSFMCLHHVESQHIFIKEIYRLLTPGGIFVLREHDRNTEENEYLINIVHGLWCLVWSNPPEDPNFFINVHHIRYHSRNDWRRLIENAGFMFLSTTEPYGPQRQYYDLFQKPFSATNEYKLKDREAIEISDSDKHKRKFIEISDSDKHKVIKISE